VSNGRQEFKFVVNGLDLPDDAQQRVAAAVYKAAVGSLADLDYQGDTASFFIGKRGRFDWDWAGGIVGPIDVFKEGIDSIRMLGER
jgi:hypothetical protein